MAKKTSTELTQPAKSARKFENKVTLAQQANSAAKAETETNETLVCRKCGVSVKRSEAGSVSREGKATCTDCLTDTTLALPTLIDAQNSLAATLAANTAQPVESKPALVAATPATKAPKATKREKEKAVDAEKADAARAEWDAITGLADTGKDRAAIAKELGVTYSRVTFVLWHKQYGLSGIPGMPEYTKEAKAEAQRRYLADVAARKQAKAEG